MRRALAFVALASASAVLLAVLIPLAVVISAIAKERAIASAGQQATAVIAVLAGTTQRARVEEALAEIAAGTDLELAVHLPLVGVVGAGRASSEQVSNAATRQLSKTESVPGGLVVLQPLGLGSGQRAVVEVFLPDAVLTHRVTEVWGVLASVTLGMLAVAVFVADRLATVPVRAVERLASAARALGRGELAERVQPSGPPELVDAAIAYNVMAEQITGLLAAERELAADLSHRLRTPLAALRLNTERLGADTSAERVRQAAAMMERELDAMINAARRSLSDRMPEHTDLAAVVADRVGFWAPLAEDERRSLTVTEADQPVVVAVNREKLATALDALIGNVFRHTGPGTPFHLGLTIAEGQVRLVVEDGGTGFIDPELALERGVSEGGSTGLGLDIVRRVVESTGGSLRLGRSSLGGARVELSFPRVFSAGDTLKVA